MSYHPKAFFTLIIGLLFMSFAAIFLKAAHAPGIVTAFHRMAIGSIVLVIPFIISVRKSKKPLPMKGVLFAIAGGICFGTDMALWGTAVKLSNATIPTLTANLAPLWVGLGSIFLFKQRSKIGFWIGVVISIIGMFVLIHNDLNGGGSNIVLGALMGLGAGLFYGIFYLVSEAGRKYLNTIQYLSIFTFSSAAYLLVYMCVLDYNFTGYDRFSYLMFIGIGLCVQVCGWFFINYSQGFIPATTVAPTLLGQPVLTFLWATLLLNERLTIWHISGGAIVILGIYIVHYSRNGKETV
jgi:drug/metabolite transporter (DMT)-like permease